MAAIRWIDNSWLDLTLGARMVIKYPGLTLVGGLGMAVAIAIGAGAASIITTLLDPALPLEEGDRVVAIQNGTERPTTRRVESCTTSSPGETS